MIPEIATQQTTISSLSQADKELIRSEKVSSGGVDYMLNIYKISNYGEIECLEPIGRNDGEFRKVRAMIPFEFMNKKAKDFDWGLYGGDVNAQKRIANAFLVNFDEFEKSGKGLYIYSKTKGSGKSMLASCLIQELIDTRPINAKFITSLDFIELTKKGFNDSESREEIEKIFNARVLVLDDLGVEMKKEFTDTVLYRLINERMSKRMVTIFTSNISIEKLKIDERTADRVFKMTIPLNLPEISVRNRKAQEENKRFLKKILNEGEEKEHE